MNSDNTASRMTQRLRAHRVLFYWSVPLFFVVVFALMFCVPTTYRSNWSLVAEDFRATDEYRTLTFNTPEKYDLGLALPRNGINEDDYEDLVGSTQLLKALLAAPVSTLDGKFAGTYGDYINHYMRKPLLTNVRNGINRLLHGEKKAGTRPAYAGEEIYLTREEAATIATIRKQIACTLDQHTNIVRIEVVTQDPLVSAQVARHIETLLQAQIEDYQKDKIQRMLGHISALTAQAESDWQEAMRSRSAEAETYRQIYDSFRRQQVVCQAQMVQQKPFTTLSEPTIVYAPKGPHRLITALLLTIVFGLLLGAWVCRREIAEAI